MLVLIFPATLAILPPSGYMPVRHGSDRQPALHGAAGADAGDRRGGLHPAHHARRHHRGDGPAVRHFPSRQGHQPRTASCSAMRCATPDPSIVTVIGIQVGVLLGGAIIVETMFALPGVGRLIVTAINQRNYPVVQVGHPRHRHDLHRGLAGDRPHRRLARSARRRWRRAMTEATMAAIPALPARRRAAPPRRLMLVGRRRADRACRHRACRAAHRAARSRRRRRAPRAGRRRNCPSASGPTRSAAMC